MEVGVEVSVVDSGGGTVVVGSPAGDVAPVDSGGEVSSEEVEEGSSMVVAAAEVVEVLSVEVS